ncbi:hypothetical protein [Enterovirga sp. CN4-39]|uniref:hypothetical protein n=1 Tax=Enterovirga sp. CN4-39 TaxID=3400910 RepID=UPI003C0F6B3F
MSDQRLREVVIEADLNEGYDGLVRLLGDSERSGYELRAVAMTTRPDQTKLARITLGIPESADTQLIAARSSRHPAVRRAIAWEALGQTPRVSAA